MKPQRRALTVDFSLAAIAVLAGALSGGLPLSVEGALIAGAGAVVFVGVLAVAEQTNVLAFVDETRPMSLIVAGAAFLAIGVVLVVGQAVVARPSATLLWGMGVGLGGYRLRYGVLKPLPEKRRKQADIWGTPPEIEPADSDGEPDETEREN